MGLMIEDNPHLLKNARPDLLKEWHPTQNQAHDLQFITKGMNLKVWWRCQEGHEWIASVNQRVRGTGCPYCKGRLIWVGFNDLATTHPHLAKEWHPKRNGTLTPQQVSKGCNEKVWWQCQEGHEWWASVKQRTAEMPTNCPTCQGRRNLKIEVGFNDLATTHPHLAKEWHPTRNDALTSQQVTCGMGRKIWWKCACGCEWRASILSRHQGRGCPDCANRGRRAPRKRKAS